MIAIYTITSFVLNFISYPLSPELSECSENAPKKYLSLFSAVFRIFYKYFFKSSTLSSLLPGQIQIIASEMSVSCCLFVDRSAQIEHADDPRRTEIEVLTDDLYQFRIGYFSCSECIDGNGGRMCHADSVGKLDLAFLCQTCCHNVLRCIACRICCGTVYLCAVLSGECAPP